MTDTFKERRLGFEAQFAHDEETDFRIHVRRDRLFGEWMADRLSLTGSEATSYARSMIGTGLEVPGDEDILQRVEHDAEEHGISISREDCLAKLHEFEVAAKEDFSGSSEE